MLSWPITRATIWAPRNSSPGRVSLRPDPNTGQFAYQRLDETWVDCFGHDAEIYAYSAVWIAYALVLLGVGIVWRSIFWRYTSLAVLIVTVLKVFLYDMSDLTGLYRVASFLGLGLTLIGIGYIYRRFVFR